MIQIHVDFKRTTGKIKPLHGINNSPVELHEPRKELAEAGIPYCRLHDTAGPFGGTRYVDIPNVFPDFNADPADPASYDFAFTDAYLTQLTAAGIQPFYRLGITIENNYGIKAYWTRPPQDFAKWAEICAGIIRHYNRGWADGFHFGIVYWEIWNEPENLPMWSGTKEQFFELYKTAALRIKQEFPELKVGGYGSCGFYTSTRQNLPEFYQRFPVWFDDFLQYVKTHSLPLDFCSWHLYTSQPEEIVKHAEYAASRLKHFGLEHTENIFDEWNCIPPGEYRWDLLKEAPGAAMAAAAFCLMQKSPIDKAMYYDALPTRCYCGLYYFPSLKVTKTYYSFRAFNVLYRLGDEVEASVDEAAPRVYVCAAASEESAALLAVNLNEKPIEVCLDVRGGMPRECIFLTDGNHLFQRQDFPASQSLTLPECSVVLLCYGNASVLCGESVRRQEKYKFAGLG